MISRKEKSKYLERLAYTKAKSVNFKHAEKLKYINK